MMEEHTGTPMKEDQSNSPPEELTKEKLILKCKNLLTIAQKAKKARDECTEKNKLLADENEKLNNKAYKLEKDVVTAQEMLATFTEQKLKLSMQMDELKKEKKQFSEDFQNLNVVNDQLETENISLKRQYTRLLNENEDLIGQLAETETRLKNALTLKSDIDKLQQNNENIKQLCSSVTEEKIELEKEYKTLQHKITSMQKEWQKLDHFMVEKFSNNSSDVDSWINVINANLESKDDVKTDVNDLDSIRLKLAEEIDKSGRLSLALQEAISNFNSTECEKNDLKLESTKLNEMNEQLKNELDSLNNDKDRMMNNLENMRIETRQLIESSEKLSEEMEMLKADKIRIENELISVVEERNNCKIELGLKNSELGKTTEKINSLLNEIAALKSKINSYEKSCSDFTEVKSKLNEQFEINKNLRSEMANLNERINNSKADLVKSNDELIKLTKSLEKSKLSENNLQSELKLVIEQSQALQNTLKELEAKAQINSSVGEIVIEKDRVINLLKLDIENLKIKFENTDDSLSSQLESLKFEKEELKCLADTLREEVMEINSKLAQNVKEKDELISQSQVRETKIFEEFKSKLIELQNNNEKLVEERCELDRNCTEKQAVIHTLNEELNEKRKRIEVLEADCSSLSKQLNDVNDLLSMASDLNKKHEVDLKESVLKFEQLSSENETLKFNMNAASESLTQLQNYREDSISCIENLKSELGVVKEDLNSKEKKIIELSNQLETNSISFKELKCKYDEISNTLTQKELDINVRNEAITSLENDLEKYKVINSELESKLQELECENTKIKEELSNKISEEGNSCEIAANLSSKLKEEITSLENSLKEKTCELDGCRRTWLGHLTVLKGAFFGLKHSYEDLKKSVHDLQEFLTTLSSLTPINFQEKIKYCIDQTLQSNKQDLLGEMQHMNQALKQRGEVISKLQNTISDMEVDMKKSNEESKDLEKCLADTSAVLEEKEKQLKFKELFIKDLETEIIRFKESNDSMTDGDMMSSSTISKAEESARLKDVEDSFEDKYTKLKLLAMKLKKRVNDLSSALEDEKNKSTLERAELIEKIQTLTSAAKNAQKLQESFDSLMDNFEEEKKKNKTLESSLQNALKAQEDLKAGISKLENETKKIPSLKKYNESLTSNLNNNKKELASLQTEKDVEVIKCTELKKELTKLEEKVSELTTSLEQAQQQSRNNNLLELEMNNYEKTIEELTAQLNCEKERLRNLKVEMESMSSVKSGLEEQIKLLENQLKIEEERNTLTNKHLTTAKEALSEVQSQLNEKSERCEILEKELQEEKQKCESLTVQTSTVTSQFTAKEKELETQLNSFQRMVCGLESKLATSEEEVLRCRGELERVQDKFDTYRTRAQAVLAKQKGESISNTEREATEQIDKLNHENQILTSKIDSLMSEMEMMKTESVTYQHDKERTDRRIEDLNKLIQYKTMELEKINSEFRTFKISTETLKQCYQNELEEKESSYKSLIDDYKHQIEDLVNSNKSHESKMKSSASLEVLADESCTAQTDNILETLPQQREEGEGSESVPSPQIRKRSTNMVPLDVLLNTPYDSESRIGLLCDRISLLEKEVSSYEVRCRHLAGLLSEAERDSARNSQLNSLLKEEIRRLERSLQRQPHAANTEYLKNVIFKFVTLQSGDEKSRLVPVLDTILKLSPEETVKLNAVAKGEVNSGWTGYLSSWTGL